MENEINSIALIGFDITEGPVLKWKKEFNSDKIIDIEKFYTMFYVMFRGVKDFKPKAIIFDEFQIVAFQDEMDLLCVFLKNKSNFDNFKKIKEIAEKEKDLHGNNGSNKIESESDKIKHKLIELLKKEKQMTIHQLKKHFPLSYWTIRRYLTDMEKDGIVKRDKEQKTHLWSLK